MRCFLCLLVALLSVPSADAVEHALVDGVHVLETPSLRVEVDPDLRLRLVSLDGGDATTIVTSPGDDPGARPSHYLTVDGTSYTLFPVLPDGVTVEPVSDPFGSGLALTLHGQTTIAGAPVEKTLVLRVYDEHPDALLMQATFTNHSTTTSLVIEELVSGYLRLDRRLANPAEPAWAFTSVQATTSRWRDWWLDVPLEPGFFRANELVSEDSHGRGGQPFLAVRGAVTGVALMSLEPGPRAIGLPCRVLGNGLVEISIRQRPAESHGQFATTLAPGGEMSTVLTAAVAHRGDYFAPARRYGLLLQTVLADHGLETFGPWPDAVYEPYWKSWGFGLDFTVDDVIGVLDGLADLGVTWIALDDGWFDHYGSWRPSPEPGKFPGGEADLIDLVASVHAPQWGAANEAMKIHTWWYPIAWESGCGIPTSYLIQDEGGSYPVTDRGHRFLCPAYLPARDEIVDVAVRFIDVYDFDGIYHDGSTLRSVPPCYTPGHGHARPIESVEAVPGLYRAIEEAVEMRKPGAPLILCECAGPHDPYKMPYANLEDASDPHLDVDVRKKVRFSKALRGPDAPVGDGYVDPIDYNDVTGTLANSVGVGAILTTLYTSPHDLGLDVWETWLSRARATDVARGTTLDLYDVTYDRPEAHATGLPDGRRLYAFYREPGETMTSVEIRGLPPGEAWSIVDLEAQADLGTVVGPSGMVPVTWHRQAPGMPEWTVLLALPPGVLDVDPATSPIRSGPSIGIRPVGEGIRFTLDPVPAEPREIRIHDVQGRRVRALVDPGGGVTWDRRDEAGRSVAPGIYFARVQGGLTRSFLVSPR